MSAEREAATAASTATADPILKDIGFDARLHDPQAETGQGFVPENQFASRGSCCVDEPLVILALPISYLHLVSTRERMSWETIIGNVLETQRLEGK